MGKLTFSLASQSCPLTSSRFDQANDNLLTVLPSLPPASHPNLSTIYLEGNPVQKTLGANYRRKVLLECPQVQQIDATYVRR